MDGIDRPWPGANLQLVPKDFVLACAYKPIIGFVDFIRNGNRLTNMEKNYFCPTIT